jgi:hypothetical protein
MQHNKSALRFRPDELKQGVSDSLDFRGFSWRTQELSSVEQYVGNYADAMWIPIIGYK